MSEQLTIRFRIDIAFDEQEEMYHGIVYSNGDSKAAPVKNSSMRKLMSRITKLVRDKNSEVRHFPLPEASLIIAPGGNGDIKLITPARN